MLCLDQKAEQINLENYLKQCISGIKMTDYAYRHRPPRREKEITPWQNKKHASGIIQNKHPRVHAGISS